MPTTIPPSAEPLLSLRGMEKSYPGVRALSGVELDLYSGEVLALLGENGAGKSTLIKILAGAQPPDAGQIRVRGQLHAFSTPLDARHAGIVVIHQEFNLIPGLSATANIFLGREQARFGFLDARQERRRALELFARLGIDVPPDAPCRSLSIAQQQTVEIARALDQRAEILILDEPTAALSPSEVQTLFSVMDELRRAGLGLIFVTHRLDEVFQIADRVCVLRDGCNVGSHAIDAIDRQGLVERMAGRPVSEEYPKRAGQPGGERLRVSGLTGGRVRGVDFTLRRGEILGLAGLVGAGRTETARLIFGADRREQGTLILDGQPVNITSPGDAIRAGICLLSEDRKGEGLILSCSVRENFGLPNLADFARVGFLNMAHERAAFDAQALHLRIRHGVVDRPVRELSGGNQQKVCLAKWLQTNAKVILFDEPTRGIDVAARHEIYQLIHTLADQGMSIMLISSDLSEVLGMSDRVLVMAEGRIVGEIPEASRVTQADVLNLAVSRAR